MARGDDPLEKDIQRDVIRYLHARGLTTAAVPNGAMLAGDGRSRARQMNMLKATGLRPGFPDLIILWPLGGVGFMEIKREGGRQSEGQIHWQGCLEFIGHRYAIVRSIEDAEETLKEWGIAA